MSAPPRDSNLSDARVILLAPRWTSLAEIQARVLPHQRHSVLPHLTELVRNGMLERRQTRRRAQWRRSNLTWRAAVVGQLGFVWIDGGPLYVRNLAGQQHSHRAAIHRDRVKAGAYKPRGPQKNPRWRPRVAA